MNGKIIKIGLGTLACIVVEALPADGAVPRAGNQCKKREIGLVIGDLQCTGTARPLWKRIARAAAPTAPQTDTGCDPNYTPCVPIASDVDCLGGKGNGPAYVQGPIRVIGTDIYGLDADHNGIGCER